MNMQLLLALWAAIFAAALAIVVLMRWKLGRREDDHLHFADSEQQLVAVQANIAHKLDVLDRWKDSAADAHHSVRYCFGCAAHLSFMAGDKHHDSDELNGNVSRRRHA